jgi:hypothetical protein
VVSNIYPPETVFIVVMPSAGFGPSPFTGGSTWPKVPGARQCRVPKAPQFSHTERQLS